MQISTKGQGAVQAQTQPYAPGETPATLPTPAAAALGIQPTIWPIWAAAQLRKSTDRLLLSK